MRLKCNICHGGYRTDELFLVLLGIREYLVCLYHKEKLNATV